MKNASVYLITILFFLLSISTLEYLLHQTNNTTIPPDALPSLSQLNTGIIKAQTYYQGLYRDLGDRGGVMAEYYSGTRSIYTIRHGAIGGYYYFSKMGDLFQANQLKKFIATYGFNEGNDIQSFIWTEQTNAPQGVSYTLSVYHDCFVSLPVIKNILPYHSKVCKLGLLGIEAYIFISRFDTFVPLADSLERIQSEEVVSTETFEDQYNALGFGMPMCFSFYCSQTASALRTAQFGELELRLHNYYYADRAASDLLKAESPFGAVWLAYDKNYQSKDGRAWIYKKIDDWLSDKPIYNGVVPSNAETMNNVLAFLFDYRCIRYSIMCYKHT